MVLKRSPEHLEVVKLYRNVTIYNMVTNMVRATKYVVRQKTKLSSASMQSIQEINRSLENKTNVLRTPGRRLEPKSQSVRANLQKKSMANELKLSQKRLIATLKSQAVISAESGKMEGKGVARDIFEEIFQVSLVRTPCKSIYKCYW